MNVTPAPRHAAPDALPCPVQVPAHYLSPGTADFPLVLLVEDFGDVGTGLPVAHGVTLSASADAECEGCGGYIGTGGNGCGVQAEASGGGNAEYVEAWHLACLVGGDHYGLVPTCYVEFVGVE